ncbi:hypothetical protein CCHL11_04165 [Colletotrichum chlorophyti]|uniref:Uncharacterized protein n=1 Tax=Colletotrichum chlorophyti TaxID=708187 RepID=A0A1Q8RPN7_9PEZI|nr:hypothetical protein CCHL11_04165 [Colletotrichum chlorophyti]
MSSAKEATAPTLPSNVTIFTPKNPSAANALLNGRIFTRLTVSAQTEPAHLSTALKNAAHLGVDEPFCLSHRNVILIFDGGDREDLEDAHHEHFRLVCLALKDADIGLDVAGCLFDATEVLKAGFQLDTLSSGSVLVIDLMGADDDDDDDSEDDEAAAQALLMSGDSGATLS